MKQCAIAAIAPGREMPAAIIVARACGFNKKNICMTGLRKYCFALEDNVFFLFLGEG